MSRALVSIAYRGVKGISPETREHIFEVAKQLGYRPNGVAARLASRYTATIGVFLFDLYNEVFADIFEGVRSVTAEEGRPLVLSVGSRDGSREREGLEMLQNARADVIIAAGLMLPDAAVTKVGETTPVVSASRSIPGIDSAFASDEAGAELAVAHLHELGHRRIAHIASPPRQGYLGRKAGYERSMLVRGLAPLVREADYSQESAAVAAASLLDLAEPPTAIFANNDIAALGVIDVLSERGLRAGADLSIVGYDDTPVARLPTVSLTSVDLHAQRLGAVAAELALRRLSEPAAAIEQRSIDPELIPRGSTTAPPRG
ncbi:transcriptional regulator, LacI family [Gulosibacter sp. 10]|nr:transcriptional regulator, LacI family [Gulosibacter sp. 10]